EEAVRALVGDGDRDPRRYALSLVITVAERVRLVAVERDLVLPVVADPRRLRHARRGVAQPARRVDVGRGGGVLAGEVVKLDAEDVADCSLHGLSVAATRRRGVELHERRTCVALDEPARPMPRCMVEVRPLLAEAW